MIEPFDFKPATFRCFNNFEIHIHFNLPDFTVNASCTSKKKMIYLYIMLAKSFNTFSITITYSNIGPYSC